MEYFFQQWSQVRLSQGPLCSKRFVYHHKGHPVRHPEVTDDSRQECFLLDKWMDLSSVTLKRLQHAVYRTPRALLCFCAGTSVPPMLQGASDIPQRPEMENPALWKQMSSWILFVPADPPVAVTDVCLGKIQQTDDDDGALTVVSWDQHSASDVQKSECEHLQCLFPEQKGSSSSAAPAVER
ncbi:unnamed protein product [Leuciscus chuanchicus]